MFKGLEKRVCLPISVSHLPCLLKHSKQVSKQGTRINGHLANFGPFFVFFDSLLLSSERGRFDHLTSESRNNQGQELSLYSTSKIKISRTSLDDLKIPLSPYPTINAGGCTPVSTTALTYPITSKTCATCIHMGHPLRNAPWLRQTHKPRQRNQDLTYFKRQNQKYILYHGHFPALLFLVELSSQLLSSLPLVNMNVP